MSSHPKDILSAICSKDGKEVLIHRKDAAVYETKGYVVDADNPVVSAPATPEVDLPSTGPDVEQPPEGLPVDLPDFTDPSENP